MSVVSRYISAGMAFSMDSGLRRNDTVVDEVSVAHPTLPIHRISLGLDPRVPLNPAQTACGPRVKPEGKRLWRSGAPFLDEELLQSIDPIASLPLEGRE